MVPDSVIVTIGDHTISYGTIFNDLERPHIQILRSGHSLMLNIYKILRFNTVTSRIPLLY